MQVGYAHIGELFQADYTKMFPMLVSQNHRWSAFVNQEKSHPVSNLDDFFGKTDSLFILYAETP